MTLRLHIDHEGSRTTVAFDTFPVRIGRDDGNECRLEFPFVSRSHCLLDVQEGRLVLRDEGSRQGTWSAAGRERLRPREFHDVESLGNEFQIGALRFQAEYQPSLAGEGAPDTSRFVEGTVDLGLDLGPPPAFARAPARTMRVAATPVPPSPAPMPAPTRALAAAPHAAPPPAPSPLEAAALRHLMGLSALLAPGTRPPATTADLEAFTARLAGALGVLLEGVAALRVAHRHESASPAPDPSRADLAQRLLDWTADPAAANALRAELRDMVSLHHRLVREMERTWDNLVSDLDPAAIEQACPASRWSPFRYKALWTEFTRRYALLRDGPSRPRGPTYDRIVAALGGIAPRASAQDFPPGTLRRGVLAA